MKKTDGNLKKVVNKVKKDYKENDYEDYSDLSDVVSSGECTGLMYAPPQNEEELESYQELYSMEIPKKEDKEQSKKRNTQ